MPEPTGDSPDFAIFTEIMIISHLLATKLERTLPDGLTVAQFGVLNHFARRGGRESPAQLAAAFQVTKGAMTNTLQRLLALGLITIVDDASDGRRKWVSITPAGSAARLGALNRLEPMMAQLRTETPMEAIAAALPVLRDLRVWLDENR